MTFDRIDLKILDILQRDATAPITRIADQGGLSQRPHAGSASRNTKKPG